VGKLSDVVKAVQGVAEHIPEMKLGSAVTVADGTKCKMYLKNFGEFYANQIQYAGAILLSRTQKMTPEALEAAVALLREKNASAPIVTTPWGQLTGAQLLSAMEGSTLADEMLRALAEEEDEDDDECGCDHDHEHHHHHHDHDEEEHEHHHHHDDDDDDHEHEHHHHDHDHDHDHEHHHHHHHHGHDADEVFTSWGVETTRAFSREKLETILAALDSGEYGQILRAKGIVPDDRGGWFHFDYVPQEHELRQGGADYTGRLCVIGSGLNEAGLKTLFEV
jgi:G3E family GTPase